MARHYKPCLLILPPQTYLVGIDLDCEIRGSLDGIFDLVAEDIVLARDRRLALNCSRPFNIEKYFNSGVIGAKRSHPIVKEWGELTIALQGSTVDDQQILNEALYCCHAQVVELPQKYNRLYLDGDNPDTVVMHWSGSRGKTILREKVLPRRRHKGA